MTPELEVQLQEMANDAAEQCLSAHASISREARFTVENALHGPAGSMQAGHLTSDCHCGDGLRWVE